MEEIRGPGKKESCCNEEGEGVFGSTQDIVNGVSINLY